MNQRIHWMILALLITGLSQLTAHAQTTQPTTQPTDQSMVLQATDLPDFSKGMIDRDKAVAAAKAITAEQYPDADQVTVDTAEWVRYFQDGSYVQWAENYVKVLTEKGKRANQTLSSVFTIPYQRGPEDCNVPLLEIIKADGAIVPVDMKKNAKLMINPSSMSQNIYNPNDKIIRINIPNLEVGDTVHYIMYDRIVKPRVRNTYTNWLGFQYSQPIKHATTTIVGPRDMPLVNRELIDAVGQTLKIANPTTDNGLITYHWEATDVPQIIPEPDMPPVHMVAQRVLVSTVPDWQTLSRWYWNLSKPHFQPSEPLKDKVKQLIADQPDPMQKIETLFRYVSQEIRYMGITAEAEAPGYEPHDVADTFRQKHGVCRDKAALLVVMLRQAGFDAFPVLIHNGNKKDPQVPQPYFNHAITGVRMPDGRYVLMDATDENTKRLLPAYLNDKSYLVATPEGDTLRTSPIIPAEKNMMIIDTTGSIDDNGKLTARSILRFQGNNDNAYRGWFARIKPHERERFFHGLTKRAAPGARVTSVDIIPKNMMDTGTPLIVRVTYEADNVVAQGKEMAMLPIPTMGQSVGMINFILGQTGLIKRQYPMLTNIACGVRENVSLEIDPKLGTLVALPKYTQVDDPAVTWQMNLRQVGPSIQADSLFKLNVVEFSPGQYQTLKQALKQIEIDRRKMPIFKLQQQTEQPNNKPQGPRPDVKIIDHRTRYDLTDTHQWKQTVQVKMKVLTYAGKKRFSELKLPFIPAWEQVNLDAAKVTTADGTVHKISDKEINLMDSPQASAAPRYPVPKVMIASLPSVEIGSVIEYQYTRTCRNRPFFAEYITFGGYDPIEHQELTVTWPKDLKLAHELRVPENATNQTPNQKIIATDPGRKAITWQAEKLKALDREDMAPPTWSIMPTVFLTTGSWPQWAQQVHKPLLDAATDQKAAAKKAAELTEDCKTDLQKIQKIRDFVVANIRRAGPQLAEMPLTYISPADRTLADGYGNNTDRAVLIHAMLNSLKLDNQVILASSTSRAPSLAELMLANPDPSLFPSVLVQLKTIINDQPTTIYLNDTSQYDALGVALHQGRAGLTMPDGKPFNIQTEERFHNRTDKAYTIVVNPDGSAAISLRETFFGQTCGNRKRTFAEMTPEQRRQYDQQAVAQISQSAVAEQPLQTSFEHYPGTETMTVSIPDFAVVDGPFMYLRLPAALDPFVWARTEKRQLPIYLPRPVNQTVTCRITYPKQYQIKMSPPTVKWNNQHSSVTITSRVIEQGKMELTIAAQIQPAVLPAKDYPTLRQLARDLAHPASKIILLGQ